MAFEVSTLDEVLRAREHLRRHDVQIHFEGRRRAGVQLAIEFKDPDGHNLEIYWGIDQVGSDGKRASARGVEGRHQPGGGDRRSRGRAGHHGAGPLAAAFVILLAMVGDGEHLVQFEYLCSLVRTFRR